jgi:hypothetical protein
VVFTLVLALRMPQGGEKPAPSSSLTNFKSIGYRDAGARSSFDSAIIAESCSESSVAAGAKHNLSAALGRFFLCQIPVPSVTKTTRSKHETENQLVRAGLAS